MLPAKQIAISQGASDPDTVAWQAGLVACIGSGLIEFFGAFIAERVRKMTPRAALLAALSGAGLAFLSLNFLITTFAHPLVGFVTLGLVLLFYFGGVKPKWGIPAALVVLLVGTALAWATGLAPNGPRPTDSVGWYPPLLVIGDVWRGLAAGHFWAYLPVVIPLGLLNLLASLQCIESAAAAGDNYDTRSSLLVNGASTLAAACFGSPFPTSIYIGHPAWKLMGARAGYSTLNGIFITALCLTGSMAMVAWAVPADAGLAIIVWIGVIIMVQSFEATPVRHWPAVVLGFAPVLLMWVTFVVKNALRVAGYGSAPGQGYGDPLLGAFHASGTLVEGLFAVEQGAFYCSIVLAAVTVFIIEKQWVKAAQWCFAAAGLSLIGLLHAWRFSAADTVSALPLLEGITGTGAPSAALFPAAAYAAGYVGMGVVLLAARWFTVPSEAEKPGGH